MWMAGEGERNPHRLRVFSLDKMFSLNGACAQNNFFSLCVELHAQEHFQI